MRIARTTVLLAAAVAGCAQSYGPKDVQLTIASDALVLDADLAAIKTLDIAVSGAFNQVQTVTLTRPLARVERIVIHLPSAHGDVVSSILGRDAQSLIVARGYTAAVHLDVGDSHTAAATLRPMPGNQHVQSAIVLAPASFTLFTGQTAQLGADGEMLAWTSTDGGAITSDGLFTAPASAGTFHAVGRSLLYPTDKGTVTLTVLANGIARFAGDVGGMGTVDGVGTAARVNSPRGMASDGKGGYFFSDNGHVIRHFDLATNTVTTIAGKPDNPISMDGIGDKAGFACPQSLVFDGNDTIYLVEACAQLVRAVKVSTGEATVLAGQRNMQGTMDGIGTAAQFRWPGGLAYDPAKKLLYVGEDLAHTIRTIDVATAKVTTVGGTASMPGYKDGLIGQAVFHNPQSLLFDPAGALYIFDQGNFKLRKWTFSSNMVTTLASNFNTLGLALDAQGQLIAGNPLQKIDGSSGASTPILDVDRNQIGEWVNSLAVSSDGNYIIGSQANILRFDTGAKKLATVAGFDFHWAETDGPRTTARMTGLTAIAVAPDGTVFARDNRLLSIDSAGNVKNIVGSNSGPIIGGDSGMTVGSDGALYALDRYASIVVRIDSVTGALTTIAGTANQQGSTDAIGTAARFANIEDITADGNKLYLTDGFNQTVRAIDLGTKAVTTLAGTAGMCGDVDMPGAAARFCSIRGIVADHKGNLYVSQYNNIKKVVIAGAVVSTLSGAVGSPAGYKDGAAATALYRDPDRLAIDPAGKYLYLSELGSDTIRRIDLADGSVSTVAGAPGKTQVVEGALPGTVNQVGAIAFLPNGDLLASVQRENVILQIRLP